MPPGVTELSPPSPRLLSCVSCILTCPTRLVSKPKSLVKEASLPATGLAPGWRRDFQRPSGGCRQEEERNCLRQCPYSPAGSPSSWEEWGSPKGLHSLTWGGPCSLPHNATLVPASLGFFSAASWSPGLTPTPQTRALIGTRVNSQKYTPAHATPQPNTPQMAQAQARLLTKDPAPSFSPPPGSVPLLLSWNPYQAQVVRSRQCCVLFIPMPSSILGFGSSFHSSRPNCLKTSSPTSFIVLEIL